MDSDTTTTSNLLTPEARAKLAAAKKVPGGTVTMVFTDIVNATPMIPLLPGATESDRNTE